VGCPTTADPLIRLFISFCFFANSLRFRVMLRRPVALGEHVLRSAETARADHAGSQ